MLNRTLMLAGLLAGLLLNVGGCPQAGVQGPTFTGAPDGGTGAGGSGTGGNTAVSDNTSGSTTGSTFTDQLSNQFPNCRTFTSVAAWQDEVLRLVNEERARAGLNAVARNATLEAQATQYACEMIQHNFFAHDNPVTGTRLRDRAEEFGYEFLLIGENLAAGQPDPQRVMSDWMGSPGHRANILNPDYEELGVGIRRGGEFGIYWVQEFGRPAPPNVSLIPASAGAGTRDAGE